MACLTRTKSFFLFSLFIKQNNYLHIEHVTIHSIRVWKIRYYESGFMLWIRYLGRLRS